MKTVHHHISKRKLYNKQPSEYPHPNPRIRFFDNIVTIVGVIFPLTALPQLYNVWIKQDIGGVSAYTWLSFFLLSIPFLIYGIIHKERPLIVMYSLWIIVDATMVIGILIN